jgi:hypothetical protein
MTENKIEEKEQVKRGRTFRKKIKEEDPHASGKNHEFGGVHPLTEGQEKIIQQVTASMFGHRHGVDVRISVENNKVFNWQAMVFSVALGIIVGVIISHL